MQHDNTAMKDYGDTDYFLDLRLVEDPYPCFEYLRAAIAYFATLRIWYD